MRHAVGTTALSIIGRVTGFFIPFSIARWFGVVPETDAVLFAFTIIVFFAAVFTSVLETSVVPFVAELRAKGGDVSRLVGGILGFGTLILVAATALFVLISRSAVGVLATFEGGTLKLVYRSLLMIIPNCVFAAWSALFSGTLNAFKRFSAPAISPAVRTSVCLLLIFLIKGELGAYSIPVAYAAGEGARALYLGLRTAAVPDFRLRLSFRYEKSILEFGRFSGLAFLAYLAGSFAPVVDRVVASWTGEGGVTILEYADKLFMVPVSFLTPALAVVLFSHWSGKFYSEQPSRFLSEVKTSIPLVAAATLALSLGLFLLRTPIAKIIYAGGRFPDRKLPELAWIFGILVLKLCPAFVGLVLANVFFLKRKAGLVLLNNAAATTLNLALDVLFVLGFGWGLPGIAWSSVAVSVWNAGFYIVAMRLKK